MRPHTIAAILWALLITVLVSPAAAHAAPARMAVMDLTKGAGGEEWDGLGMALSGMLVSDLMQVDQLALVERQRLEDVVGELKLSEGEFIDPKTAQKLGRGLGADLILVGSFSVVGKTIVLDGRIVDVASGEVKGAGSATGTMAEWVAVEKDLIDQLIQALNIQLGASVKRKIMIQAQTESFAALAAYGEGLKRKKQGRADDAKAAFQRATQLDPEFAAAKAALSEMRSKVQAHEEALEDWKSKLKADAHRTVLEAFPDESTRPEGFVHDYKSLAELTLRLIALEQAGLHCQRAKEMRAFLDRMEWKLDAPLLMPEGVRANIEAQVRKIAPEVFGHLSPDGRESAIQEFVELELRGHQSKVDMSGLRHRHQLAMVFIHDAVQATDEAEALEAYTKSLSPHPTPRVPSGEADHSFYHLYIKTMQMWNRGLAGLALGNPMQGDGIKGALKACLSGPDYLEALEELTAQIHNSGAADSPIAGGSTLGLVLEMELTEVHAQTHGATPALQKRMDAMLAKHPIGTPQHTKVLAHAKKITAIAQKQSAGQRIQSDMSKNEIEHLLLAAIEKDSTAFRTDTLACSIFLPELEISVRSFK